MSNLFYYPSPPSPVIKRASSKTGIDYDYFPKDQYYRNNHLVAMPIFRGRKQFYNNMRNELTGINKREQMVKPLKSNNSNNFFTMMKKSKKQQRTLSPKLKFSDYCSSKNKECKILYRHYVITNGNEMDKLLLDPSSSNIRNYVKYLLKVRKDTKKALGIDKQDLLVDLFLENLKTNNQVIFFSVLNEKLFIDSFFSPKLKGGSRKKRKSKKSRNTKKKRNLF